MRLLLDTHAFLWWDDGKLPAKVVARIRDADEVYVRAATAWEIAIKSALGKIDVAAPVARALDDYAFRALAITLEHADAARSLPPRHRDPFDRMLVAQALVEGLSIVSKDPLLAAYGARVLWT